MTRAWLFREHLVRSFEAEPFSRSAVESMHGKGGLLRVMESERRLFGKNRRMIANLVSFILREMYVVQSRQLRFCGREPRRQPRLAPPPTHQSEFTSNLSSREIQANHV
jgi:hypothetical protein